MLFLRVNFVSLSNYSRDDKNRTWQGKNFEVLLGAGLLFSVINVRILIHRSKVIFTRSVKFQNLLWQIGFSKRSFSLLQQLDFAGQQWRNIVRLLFKTLHLNINCSQCYFCTWHQLPNFRPDVFTAFLNIGQMCLLLR